MVSSENRFPGAEGTQKRRFSFERRGTFDIAAQIRQQTLPRSTEPDAAVRPLCQLHAEFFLREGERAPQLCSGTAPGVLSALRQIVLLARARVRLYESAKENALPLAPETARRFAAECRAEEIAAARLLALSMK